MVVTFRSTIGNTDMMGALVTDTAQSGPRIDKSALEQLLAGLTAVRGGDFSTRLAKTGDPLMDEIATVFNGMADQLDLFTSEVTRVAREVGTDGKLGGQAYVPGVSGTWKDLTDSVNAMADNLTAQVRGIAEVATAVAKGDLTQKIRVDARGEILELKETINTMVDQLSGFADEVTRVAREVGTEGRLGGQADVKGVSGTWKDLTESVNVMAANLTAQVRSIAEVTTAVAGGDLSQKIRVDARGEILELKETINTMVDQLSAFADEVTRVARDVGTRGQLGGQANVRGVSGTWKDLTDNVNVMASNLTAQVRSIAQVATAVARGDLSQQITVEAKGEVAALAQTINTMVGTLSAFAGEVTRVAREVGTEGRLGGQASVPNVAGTWKDLTDNVNSMANNLTGQVRNIAQVTTAVAQGDLSKKIDVDARGEILELKTTINTMVDQLSSFAAEVTRVAREVGRDGKLGGQAEVEGLSVTGKPPTENVNELSGTLTRQVRAIAEVTSAVAAGDLTRSITVEAQGEVADLKDNINTMVRSLRETTRANREQDWLNASLARIASLTQGHRDLAVVAELIMEELPPLVGAQHGTFFLAEADGGETRLRLIAGYGLRAGKDEQIQYRIGQSLIGQAAMTRKPIVVTSLPEDYVRISSGLGGAPPASLVVLPIHFEGQVLGVIELASFSAFRQAQIDFLTQLTENLGVIVNTLVANARTDALLEESQRLAGELQARSGELQARQEELQRSNAELAEKAAQLTRQNRDIEAKNAEIERARREIEERARQLDLASRYKTQFLANMSHELRTPLNSILILARLLGQNADANLTARQVEYATVIHSSATDLLQLINDILDLSRVEAGRLDLHPEPFTLPGLLDDLETMFSPLAAEKGLSFTVSTSPEVPAEILSDQQRLRQILRNLLSNAIKFTEQGEVGLDVARADRAAADSGHVIAFSVTDTGIGIPPSDLGTVFEAFQQGDSTTSRRHGGAGLGLAISRQLAAQLGGWITAESEPGRGSTFTLYLPASYAAPGQAGPAAAESVLPAAPAGLHASLKDRAVLLIDDDLRNAFALSRVLEQYGMTVRHLPDGRNVPGVLDAQPGGFDLVLMDIMLPDMDGYAIIGEIRGQQRFAGLPVIAVTARAMPGDREKALQAGATDYVTKPVDTEDLLSRMERWLAGGQPAGLAAEVGDLLSLAEASEASSMSRLAEIAVRQISWSSGAVSTLWDGQRVVLSAASHPGLSGLVDIQESAGHGPTLDAVAGAGPVRCADTLADGRWPEFTREALHGGVRCWLTVARRTGTAALSLLVLGARPRAIADDQAAIATSLLAIGEAVLGSISELGEARAAASQMLDAAHARAVVDQAKGILMQALSCDADEALARRRDLSQRHNVKVTEVARRVIENSGPAARDRGR